MAAPLWSNDVPQWATQLWSELKKDLSAAKQNWAVWIAWYEARLAGQRSLSEDFDLAIATLPNQLWQQGPTAVNARIAELLAQQTSSEPIPAQGAGPHFALGPELKIALAPPGEIDAAGNNVARIGQLLPVVRQAAGDLAGHLNPNTQPEISRIVGDYRAATAGEPETIAWGTLFGLGVRLESAAAAARREIVDRLRDPLEDAPQEALDSLLTLHGPLMLATAEGRELADEADRFRQTREQQAELRRHAQRITANLTNSPEIIEASAARLGEEAAAAIGEGPHPERGTVFGLATVRNIGTLLVAAGTLGAVHWVASRLAGGGETGIAIGTAAASFAGLKAAEIERVRNAARVFGSGFAGLAHDQAELVRAQTAARMRLLVPFRDFVTANEEPLRRIAENTTQLRWMLSYIDFIVRANDRGG